MNILEQDYLEPITSKLKPKKFAVVDIESKDADSQKAGFTRPFLIGVYDSESGIYVEFRNEPHLASRHWKNRGSAPGGCIDKALTYLLSTPFKGYRFYAHNGGNFDYLHFLRWLREHDDEFGFEVVPVQSSIQMIRVWRLPENEGDEIKETWEFLDSMKLFPKGLETMLKTFGLGGKVKQDLDVHEDDPSWGVYLKQDCVGLAGALKKMFLLVEADLGGEIGMTAPSTSMKLFRRKYLTKRIQRHAHFPDCAHRATCMGCAHEWVRRGYYGGRTEVFTFEGKGLHYYDLNSSYVAAMCGGMPIGERRIEKKIDWRLMETYAGFAECTVHIPEDCYLPPLPHRAESGKLIFPVGTFHGVWSLEELKLLSDPLVKGTIVNVVKVVWFRRVPVFKEMMENLWKLRDKTLPNYDEGLSELAKLMGNSLYGKFGMKRERTSIVFRRRDAKKNECFLCGEPGDEATGICFDCEGSKPADAQRAVWYKAQTTDAGYIIPHIAAHITALARVRLFEYMKMALEAGGRLFYCDTDSIITDAVLPSSKKLGELKDEYPGTELEGVFVQPKVYMITGTSFETPKVTMKGVPKKLRTQKNLEALRKGESVSYMNLEKVRSLARTGFRTSPDMVKVTKSFAAKCKSCGMSLSQKDIQRKKRCRVLKAPCVPGPSYDKRLIEADGLNTRPVVLHESAFEDAAAE